MSVTPLWAALSFLTRLVPARVFTPEDMAASPRYFPVAGLLLGAMASFPLALFAAPSLADAGTVLPHPSLFAFLAIILQFWATRGLHWDGLADCLDAWGSGKHGAEFQRILKDSRIGTFGVMGIVLTFAAQLLALAALLEDLPTRPIAVFGVLLLAPTLGRAAMLILPALLPPLSESTLGRVVAPGCTRALAAGWWVALLALWAWADGPASLCLFLALASLPLISLYRLARREGGFNGDFLGCACLAVESAALFAAALA